MAKKVLISNAEHNILKRKRAEEALAQARTTPLIQLEMEVASDMVNLEAIRNMVQRTYIEAKITDLDEEWVWQMELVLNEAAVNIIKHAYHLRKDGRIKIESEVFMDKLIFYLHHWGEDFEWDAIPAPPFDGEQESGYGLFIIDSYIDEAIYSTDENGRKSICLIKNRN
jgi:anti-sigma regulatory factor (Ser/Thr protein kinase)